VRPAARRAAGRHAMAAPRLAGVLLAASVGAVVAPATASAQDASAQGDAPLIGDRPDFTESPNAVPRLQIEGGYTLTRVAESTDHALGELLLRIPLAPRLEGRIGLGSFVSLDEGDGPSGYAGSSLGLKWQVASAAGAMPDLGVLLATTLPTGASGLGADEWIPEVRVAAAWDGPVSLSANAGVARPVAGTTRVTEFLASLAAGVGVGSHGGAFLELYAIASDGDLADDRAFVDGGVTWLLTPDFQVDARVGASLDGGLDGTEYTAGVGFVVRR
jgi:hypothetical protein